MGVKRKFVGKLNSPNQYQQDQSELKLILHQLFSQVCLLFNKSFLR